MVFISKIFMVKGKMHFIQSLRLCKGRTAHRGSRDIVIPFHDHGTRRGWGVSVTPRPLFTPGKDPVLIVQEVGWAPGPVWTGAENLAPTGIRSPDRPARGQSLYLLRYPAHSKWFATFLRFGVLRRVDRWMVKHFLKGLVCHVVPNGKWIATFLRIVVPSFAKSRGSKNCTVFWTAWLLAMSVTIYLLAGHNIPQDLNSSNIRMGTP